MLKRKHWSSLMAAVVVMTACGSDAKPEATSTGRSYDPCRYLPAADAVRLLGSTATRIPANLPGEPETGCSYTVSKSADEPSQLLTVTVEDGHDIYEVAREQPGVDNEDVPGIGDAAYRQRRMAGEAATLFVRAGGHSLIVIGESSVAEAAARVALEHLDAQLRAQSD